MRTTTPSALRRLAPEVGLHTPDLFPIPGVDVPGDLAPVDSTAGRHLPDLVRHAVAPPPRQRTVLRRYVASLPQRERVAPPPGPPPYQGTRTAPVPRSCA
ncbi:hypothetical protein PV703_14615 [Streptomyces sp. ME01-24h]|nr:hypothetical protein [Streptomyces sp. ME19-03-3]MDX3354516.1 hypothetical protein [Streptomyces sp. ME01-24h]